MIEESYGTCTECGIEAILGNGLCVKCWNAEADKTSRPRDIAEERYGLQKESVWG